LEDIVALTNFILEKKLKELELVKPYKKIKKFICFRCQKFGHIARNCTGKIKCKYCGGEHYTRTCSKRTCKKCGNYIHTKNTWIRFFFV